MAGGLLALATGPAPPWGVASAALLGLGFSFPWSSIGSTVLRRTPPGERGSAVSFLSAFFDMSVGSSAFAAGWIAQAFGYSAAFLMAAAALIGAAIVGRWVFADAAHGPAAAAATELEMDL